MIPALLEHLFWDVCSIPGIGTKKAGAYHRLGCKTLLDLLFHFPSGFIDRSYSPPISQLMDEKITTQTLEVIGYRFSQNRGKSPQFIVCANTTGEIELVYFNFSRERLKQMYPLGRRIIVSGKAERNIGKIQIVHPDIIIDAKDANKLVKQEPIYPVTYGLNSRFLGTTIRRALSYAPELPEWISKNIVQQMGWSSWLRSLKGIHYPKTELDIGDESAFKQRLVFDEILAHQLTLHIMRSKLNQVPKVPNAFQGRLKSKLLSLLPFDLTSGQKQAIAEIEADQSSSKRMARLVLGDVGSGKTLVALAAMLNVIEAGKQAALMAPTEILATQHFNKIKQLLDEIDIDVVLLVGKMPIAKKREAIDVISTKERLVIIGTHALFQEKVNFCKLGIAIIDEQHRFGVEQRHSLVKKGDEVDFLMMSATPIPRTLYMVLYGDLDLSLIKEKPAERQEIITSIIGEDKLEELIMKVVKLAKNGQKIYWICPLIEESEKIDISNITDRFRVISAHLPDTVGMIHGKMSPTERNEMMQRFLIGDLKVLVATTVVEVGVDIRDATVIIIESAERFGLSQLHQLRGRVGRGDKVSYCVLLHKKGISHQSYQRLKVLRNSNDGFHIAEEDLRMRGEGALLGTEQSGIDKFKRFNINNFNQLVPIADQLAREIVDSGIDFNAKNAYSTLLALYGYEVRT